MIKSESELHEKLAEDSDEIQLSSDVYITEEFETVEEFSGTFDGQDYTVHSLDSSFIKTLQENSVIKNIKFKDIDLNSSGVFKENNGLLQSVDIKNVTGNINNLPEENGVGIIAEENNGVIRNCDVSSVTVNCKTSIGGICENNIDGSIINCDMNNIYLNGETNIGGICAESLDGTSIQNCSVNNSILVGTNAVGGILGRSGKNVVISNCEIIDTEIECEYLNASGVIARLEDKEVEVHNCIVKNSEIIGYRGVSAIMPNESKFLQSCSVINCFIESISPKHDLFIFTETVKEYLITDTVLKCNGIKCDSVENIKNSYINLKVISNSPIDISLDSNSFYKDIDQTINSSDDNSTIHVSKIEDLNSIQRFDTIELCNDIDFSSGSFETIDRFSGVFNGNGYTLSNLHGPLFNFFSGKIENLSINGFCSEKYSRFGSIAKYSTEAIFKNLTVVKNESSTEEDKLCGLVFELLNGEIRDCSIKIDINRIDEIFGICELLEESVVTNCETKLNMDVFSQGSGGFYRAFYSPISNINTSGNVVLSDEHSSFYGIAYNNSETLSSCTSDVTITKKKSVSEVYNVAGVIFTGEKVSKCKFTGSIILENVYSVRNPVGAIASTDSKVINCINTGNVTVTSGNEDKPFSIARKIIIGGIIGEAENEVHKCVNKGELIGEDITGGIVGKLRDNGVVSKCKNINDILQATSCGGLIGKIDSTNAQIRNCYNHAMVHSNDVLIGDVTEESDFITKNLFYISKNNTQTSIYGKKTEEDLEKLNIILNL